MTKIQLRKNYRIIKGVLIATNGMVQGEYRLIPLTSNIGYQHQCHVVIHLKNAEPDLGRKGFQPEIASFCDDISVQLVNQLKGYRALLSPNSKNTDSDVRKKKKHEWIKAQERLLKKPA